MIDKDKIRIRAFRACEDVESSQRFVEGHQRVLSAHGVTKVTSLNVEWIYNPAVFVLIVESVLNGKVYGGARVHAAGGTQQLPIEQATGYMDEKVYDVVHKQSLNGTGELCGLWNSIEVAGLGIGSFFATRAGVVICEQLGLNSLFALCAPYTVRWAERVGCRVLKSIGNEGTFYYPKLDLLATVVLLEDTKKLTTAKSIERDKISHLRKNLNTVLMENPPGKKMEVEITYDLNIPDANHMEFKHKFNQALK